MSKKEKLQLIKSIFRGDLLKAKSISKQLKTEVKNNSLPEIFIQNDEGLFYSYKTKKSYTAEEIVKEFPGCVLIECRE
jgi:hypothetical protein